MVFKVAIGVSQNWDSTVAGNEAVNLALSNLAERPSLIFVFATIHYEKNNGFAKIIKGIYSFVDKETILVGGSVAGFMSNSGCFTMGVVVVALFTDEANIAVAYGTNTKRNPTRVAQTISEVLKQKGHSESNFIISLYSAGNIPTFPGFPRENVIKSKIKAKIGASLMGLSLNLLQKGIGRDEEFLNEIVAQFASANIISGSLIDDISCLRNYQFYNDKVLTNSAVVISLKTKLHTDVLTKNGLIDTGKEFQITKINSDRTIIFEINGKPAKEELLRILGWPSDFLQNRIYDRVWYYPVSFSDNDRIDIPSVIPLVMGDYLLCAFPIKGDRMKILTTSGKNLFLATSESLEYFSEKTKLPLFGFIVSCGIRLLTLKSRELVELDMLKKYFGENPFLVIFVAGEATYSPAKGLKYGNDTINTAVIWK